LKFCRRLPATDEAQEAGRQLRRAANSTRSNYRAARRSQSRAAFRAKLQIAFEEADECVDWLKYLKDGRIHEDAALLQEAKELASILATAVRTAHRNVRSASAS
jgi:four helix bundle protein